MAVIATFPGLSRYVPGHFEYVPEWVAERFRPAERQAVRARRRSNSRLVARPIRRRRTASPQQVLARDRTKSGGGEHGGSIPVQYSQPTFLLAFLQARVRASFLVAAAFAG